MADETASLIVSVDKRLNSMSSIARCDPYLFKVPSHLRRVNEKAYEPEMIAIGPYHHDRDYLQAMTKHKWRYLHQLLQRLNEGSAASYIKALSELEEKARLCYAEPITLDKDMFVQMLLLDGCFVVELIRKMTYPELVREDDPICKFPAIRGIVIRDMLLLENQLPFFVLQKLFDMTRGQERNFIGMILSSFSKFTQSNYRSKDENASQNVRHLLGLIHDTWLPCSSEGRNARGSAGGQDIERNTIEVLLHAPLLPFSSKGRNARGSAEGQFIERNTGGLGIVGSAGVQDNERSNEDDEKRRLIRCATELREAGIQFKRAENGRLSDMQFVKGRILIPKLKIEDGTDSFYRNLIAYEQFLRPNDPPHNVIDYVMFMDCLINTEKDVEELCRRGIIVNYLGDDKVVAGMFNKLLHNVCLYHESDNYTDIYERVNKHCRGRWNVELANLRHNYFNSPWALISFLAAVVLLILTVVQTIYSAMSYH